MRRPRARCARWLAILALGAGMYEATAEEPSPVSFSRQIAPLLHRRCAACHNEESAKGHYRLDTFARLQKPGISDEEPIVAGEPERSPLFHLLLEPDAEERMPQKADPLPEGEIALLRRWIAEGAKYDGGAPGRPLVEMARATMLRPAPEHYMRPVPITALAFSPKGEQLAVAGYYEVTLWNVADGQLVRRLGGLPERITSIAWHPKTNLLAVTGGSPGQWGTVALIDPAMDYRVRILCDLPETALSVAFSPDGTQLAVGGGDRTMRLFDVSSGRQIRLLRQHADWVQTVGYSRDGAQIVSASRDRTVRVLEAAKGELEATYSRHETPLLEAAFGGNTVFSLAAHAREIHRWEVTKADDKPKLFTFPAEVRLFAVDSAQLLTATGADHTIGVTQLLDGLPLYTLYGHRETVQAFALHPSNGQVFASGSFDGEVIVWNLACGTWVQRFVAAP